MLINGSWLQCPDGFVRPVLRGKILGVDGRWVPASFLVDVAADRTVFSANILGALHLMAVATQDMLGGVGGIAPSIVVETQICLFTHAVAEVHFRGRFAAVTDPHSLEMSVLGRDITDLFAVIVDRPGDVVCLLGQKHKYTIVEQ
jgi:hypothetical protein